MPHSQSVSQAEKWSGKRPITTGKTGGEVTLGVTWAEAAGDLHGYVPLPILTGEELVVPLQSVALVTEVLYHGLLGEAGAGGRVAPVPSVLWLRGGGTHWGREERERWRQRERAR